MKGKPKRRLPTDLATQAEAARRVGVGPGTVAAARRAGPLSTYAVGGKNFVSLRECVKRWPDGPLKRGVGRKRRT